MTTGRGIADQAADRGHSRGRADQPFIIVPNPNYVLPSMAIPPPPTIQRPVATVTLPPMTEAVNLESSRGSEVTDAPQPLPIFNGFKAVGSFFTNNLRTFTLNPSFTSTTIRAINPEKGVDLRLQVQELTCSLPQQVQKLNNYRERYQGILTCVTDTNNHRLEWREHLE
ncbi:uncharacterized protein DS421_9g264300 [Arachis hypogaea]|nr:uncharacterized protein DS421_9g264300 [Arachis hypogaea]